MTYYTNNQITDLKGTATIVINKDLMGKFSGETLKKGSKIVVSDAQYDTLMSVIDDGNCEWDVVVDLETAYVRSDRDQFTLSYTEEDTNFSLDSLNC
tara:strand:+ start:551 stop:841 length:291 start_codon:yes stop_codon:yes gene_type:complete